MKCDPALAASAAYNHHIYSVLTIEDFSDDRWRTAEQDGAALSCTLYDDAIYCTTQ